MPLDVASQREEESLEPGADPQGSFLTDSFTLRYLFKCESGVAVAGSAEELPARRLLLLGARITRG